MHFLHSSVVGIPSKSTWSTTASWKLDQAELWCACGFSGGDSAPHQGRKFIQFLENLRPQTAQELYQALQQFLDQLEPNTVVSYSLAFVQNRRILLLTAGYGAVALARQNRWRWLIDGNAVTGILEGDLSPGDTLVLGTARVSEIFPTGDHLVDSHPDTVVADLLPKLQRVEQNGEIAAVIMHLPGENGENGENSESSTPSHTAAGRGSRSVQSAEDTFAEESEEIAESAVETEEEISETPVAVPTKNSRQHLISPEKILAGISAAQESGGELTRPHGTRLPKLKLPLLQWKQLHLIRILLVILVIAGVIGAMFGMRMWRIQQEYDEVIIPLESMTQEVSQFSEEERFAQREAAKSLLERLQATKVSYTANRQKLQQMVGSVQSIYDQTSGEKTVVNLPTFYDFRLVTSQFLAAKAGRDRNLAFFLDTDQNQVISLDLETKRNERVATDGLTDLKDVTTTLGSLYFLSSSGITQTSLTGSDPKPVGSLSGVSEPFLLESFGESVYVLDRAGQQIWRLSTSDASASPSSWLRAARGVDMTSVTSMAINGSIWLGTENGDVFKLTRGEREEFTITGLVEPFTTTVLLAANPDGEKLIVVEPAKKRVVIINKETGEYLQQISSEQVGAVTDLFLSEDETALFLTAGSVVYRVEI